jgi:hypothetical protein
MGDWPALVGERGADADGLDPQLVHEPEEGSMSELLLDRAGRRRSPATMPGFHAGRPPRNKGLRYPPIRQRSMRSSPSCAPPVRPRTATGYAD